MKTCLWFIYKKRDTEELTNIPISIVTNKKEFNEFVYRHICISNYQHFSQWAEIHELDVEDDNTMLEYVSGTKLEEIKKYFAKKLYFKKSGIATVFRMFNKCLPVDASYETQGEQEYINGLLEDLIKNADLNEEVEV